MLIALGVTGGIGVYKAVEVARGLQQRGHEVVAVMTATATRFVGPLTFEAITRRRVITDQFEPGANADIEHIALASTIDLLLIARARLTKTSIRSATSAIDRRVAWASRSRTKRRGAAPRSRSSPDPPRCRRRRCGNWCASGARRRCMPPCWRAPTRWTSRCSRRR